jgi:hypothetical protein
MCITLHSAFFSCISDPVHILRCTYTTHVYSFKCIAALLHYTAFVFFAAFIRITSTAHSVLAYALHSIAYGRITTTDAYYTHSISTHSKRIYDTVHSSLTAYNICCIRLHSLLTAYNTCCIQTHCSLHAFVGDRIHTHTESYTHAAFVCGCICVHSSLLHFQHLHASAFALHSMFAAFILYRILVQSRRIFGPMHSCHLLHLLRLHPLRIHLCVSCKDACTADAHGCVQMHVDAHRRARMRIDASCKVGCTQMCADVCGCAWMRENARRCARIHTNAHAAESALMLQDVVE